MPSQTQTVDVVMVDSSHGLHLFDEATTTIQAAILEVHRKDFFQDASASLLLDELQSVSTSTSPSDRRLVVHSQKFDLFIRNFAPYCDILSLCVNLRPEQVSALWGIVRLIFKISSNYAVFLEKIADMFDNIAQIASPYRQIYDICKRNALDSHFTAQDHRSAALLSNAYLDVVHFCLDIYRIFCRSVPAYSASGEPSLSMSGPHPSTLLRPLDYRFAKLESRLVYHRDWLEKETEVETQNYSEVALRRQEYAGFLNLGTHITSINHIFSEEQILAKRTRRIDKARRWLLDGSPKPQTDHHQPHQPLAGSCDWFFKESAFRRWRNTATDEQKSGDIHAMAGDWQHRILFVQAGEGFGKTVIAEEVARILEVDGEGVDPSDELCVTVSFHFDVTYPRSCNADYAIRSLASQLLHTHRRDRLTLDTACLLPRRTSLRETATTEEVLDVLSLLLYQHATYLVIDGLDECSNVDTFLAFLAQVCRKSVTKAILFSRPGVKIPLEYQKWASDAPYIFTLSSQHNEATIEHHVAQTLNQMADQGFFGIAIDRTMIPRVAYLSNGNFLWVRMLLLLLQSIVLTAEERYAILQNIQLLEGLDPLYRNILGALSRRPARERRLMADAFRWLSYPIHNLSPSAMRAALSIADNASSEEVHKEELVDTLPDLSCGLLHLEKGVLTFTHRSVAEYLQTAASQTSEFSLHNSNEVHAHLAARCLTYLVHNVPQQPLAELRPHSPSVSPSSGASQRTDRSGDSGYKSLSPSDGDILAPQPSIPTSETAAPSPNNEHNHHPPPFDTHLPFLRYATLCWPIHLTRALSLSLSLSLSPQNHSTTTTQPSLPYLAPLTAFLTSRLTLTVWVEASYRYNFPPTLSRLIGPLSNLKALISPASVQGREIRKVVGVLREVCGRLEDLKREGEGALRGEPGLVWLRGGGVGEEEGRGGVMWM
ncbi:hypothetical protein NX059_009010 [Plenodomus lindquistii]|nr:hypothetical protein NX059_009010 [Plenodomus lindquistii]